MPQNQSTAAGRGDQVHCTAPARYVNVHRAKLRLGLPRARLGSRDRLGLGLGLSQRNVMQDSRISVRALH